MDSILLDSIYGNDTIFQQLVNGKKLLLCSIQAFIEQHKS